MFKNIGIFVKEKSNQDIDKNVLDSMIASLANEEVNLLMKLLNTALKEQVPNLIENSVKLNFIVFSKLHEHKIINSSTNKPLRKS